MDATRAISQIEQRINKLQQLKDLLSDPELAELINQTIIGVREGTFAPTSEGKAAGRLPKGALKEAVIAALPEAGLTQFSAYDLVDRMRESGFEFVAANPGIAVADVLRNLTEKGEIRIFRNGAGSSPTIYERPPHISPVLQSVA